jgi:hypothetical protein
MESFFKTLKVERVYQTRYESRAQARIDLAAAQPFWSIHIRSSPVLLAHHAGREISGHRWSRLLPWIRQFARFHPGRQAEHHGIEALKTMRSSTLIIIAGGLLSATTFSWSELRSQGRRTISDIYRDAKAGRVRSSLYRKLATLASLVLTVVGLYLAISGD